MKHNNSTELSAILSTIFTIEIAQIGNHFPNNFSFHVSHDFPCYSGHIFGIGGYLISSLSSPLETLRSPEHYDNRCSSICDFLVILTVFARVLGTMIQTHHLIILDLEVYPNSTIVNSRALPKSVGRPDRFGDTKISKLFIKKSILFKT